MSTWRKIIVYNGEAIVVEINPISAKNVPVADVSSEVKAVVGNVVTASGNSTITKEYKFIDISDGFRTIYEDVNGKSVAFKTSLLDKSKLDALITAIKNL